MLPEVKSFSPRNLLYMHQFFKLFSGVQLKETEITKQVVSQLGATEITKQPVSFLPLRKLKQN
ncbi:MAG: hypothetical protein IJ858_09705 [Acidaminococcaceae bacterium]|nr:hypothetical protein [Acidaminococcaceae bacterium]